MEIDHDGFADWVHLDTTMTLLQLLLDAPTVEPLGIGAVLPVGGLRDAHVVHLAELAESLQEYFLVDHKHFAYAMYAWLFALLGGSLQLAAPTLNRADSRNLGAPCRAHAKTFFKTQARLQRVCEEAAEGTAAAEIARRRLNDHMLSTEFVDSMQSRLAGMAGGSTSAASASASKSGSKRPADAQADAAAGAMPKRAAPASVQQPLRQLAVDDRVLHDLGEDDSGGWRAGTVKKIEESGRIAVLLDGAKRQAPPQVRECVESRSRNSCGACMHGSYGLGACHSAP